MYSKKVISGIGKSGEDFVAEYLRKNGSIVIKQNFSNRFGEIDIIAEDDNYIVFVEVKTRKANSLVAGAEAVDAMKINRIRNLASDFLNKFSADKPPRFDVAEVTYIDDSSPDFSLEYISDAF